MQSIIQMLKLTDMFNILCRVYSIFKWASLSANHAFSIYYNFVACELLKMWSKDKINNAHPIPLKIKADSSHLNVQSL